METIPEIVAEDTRACCLQDIEDWVLNRGKTLKLRQLIPGFCHRLIEAGVPLQRCNVLMRQLHPQYFSRSFIWNLGDELAVESPREHGIERTSVYLNSPLYPIYEHGQEVRRRLIDPATPRDFPILEDLADQGTTDYLACALPFRRGSGQAITIATDDPDGFSDENIALVKAALPAFATVAELINLERMAQVVLQTYIGERTGRQVTEGRIRRGDVRSLRAVLLYTDLRGFTELSENLPGADVIELLNDYFETIAEPIGAAGGEIMKFIGDAMLAVLPVSGSGKADAQRACEAAFAAADTAMSALGVRNARRRHAGKPAFSAGMALHVGDVLYGNIGTMERLDFTVIGPAVNLVSRIEHLCGELNLPMVMSAAFAGHIRVPVRSLGQHSLKGIAEPHEIFAPA